jgi:hypothetical protein
VFIIGPRVLDAHSEKVRARSRVPECKLDIEMAVIGDDDCPSAHVKSTDPAGREQQFLMTNMSPVRNLATQIVGVSFARKR